MSFDLNYTDKPFLYNESTGLRMPKNGFKRYSNSYTVGDVWESNKVMEEYGISTSTILKLKTCFERMNRKSKKNKNKNNLNTSTNTNLNNGIVNNIHNRLRLLFNEKYMKLLQIVVKTNYRYNMRKFIITPPITQSTYQYDSLLRYLCRLDNLKPNELRLKRIKKNIQNDMINNKYNKNGNNKNNLIDNTALQRIWKDFMTVELVNKSIKDQTQGGKSFLKQVVLAGKHFNSCYGKVLPDPTLDPDEIGLPSCIMESLFKGSEMNKAVIILKRDPVFSSDAITLVLKIKRNPYPYITLPSEIITQKQLDFDGDNVTLYIMMSPNCFIEVTMRVSGKISMYCYFSRTRLTFSQTNGFRIHGLLKHLESFNNNVDDVDAAAVGEKEKGEKIKAILGNTFDYCRRNTHSGCKVSEQLFETLLSLSQQYGPFVAYGYVMSVREASFDGYNKNRIYPIGPYPKRMALHIAESGSKGSKNSVDKMFDLSNFNGNSLVSETIDYAKLFIEAKNIIKKQGHNAKKMDSAFQNVIIDHDDNLVMKVDKVVYNLGHVVNYIQREWVFSDLTTNSILNNINENSYLMKNKTVDDNFKRINDWENEIYSILSTN